LLVGFIGVAPQQRHELCGSNKKKGKTPFDKYLKGIVNNSSVAATAQEP
jgi:hypothetical protein